MDEELLLQLHLDFWDNSVGAFEPEKCLQRVIEKFDHVDVDPTDHQEIRLIRELEHWNSSIADVDLRNKLINQSKRLYRGNGPTYRFVIRFPGGHEVRGTARRLSFGFSFSDSLPSDVIAQLRQFLLSFSLGSPTIWSSDEPSDPTSTEAAAPSDP